MKLKATDLMVGDWVKINDVDYPNPARIGGIKKEHGTFYAYFPQWDLLVCYEKLEPIEITAEFLEKNDFSPIYDDKSAYRKFWSDENEENYWSIMIDLKYPNSSRIFSKITTASTNKREFEMNGCIRFVHELQHYINQFQIDKEVEI